MASSHAHRKSVLLGAIVVTQFAAGAAIAATCTEPTPFTEIPSGASASREEMLAAQRAMKAYDNAVKAFSDCVHDSGGDANGRVNQAVERLQKLADRFNLELHTFKERNGGAG
jgi:hypothetical protein